MNTFGLHTFAIAPVWDLDLIEPQMERLKGLGIGLLEIPLLRPEEIDTKRTRAFAERWNVELIPSLGLPASLDVVARPDEALAFLEPAFGVCEAVGSAALGGVTYGTIGKTSGRAPTEQEIDGMCRFLVRAAKAATAHGLKLGIEPCNRYETHLLNTSSQALAFLELLDEPNVTIHLDTYHMNIEEKGIGQGFRSTAKHCAYVHLSESDRGVPGTGTIDWDEIFRTLADIGFKGRLVVESFVTLPPEIAAALSVWRPVARDRQEVLARGVPFLKGLARVHGLV